MPEQVGSLKTGIKYKDTPIGKIPVDWEITSIEKICNIKRGASPRPIGDSSFFSATGRGWIRISDVTTTYKYLKRTSQYLSEKGVAGSVKVNPGDLIMSICATIGKPILLGIEACIHDGFVLFSGLSEKADSEFLFYFLQNVENKFTTKGQVGTQGNLNTSIVRKTILPLPPLSEQKKIAKILSTVDDAIEKTTQIIEKTKEVKKGLMQRLLTRGIGHKKFKKTEIGEIPEEWEVMPIKSILIKRKIKDPRNFPNQNFKYVDISSISNEAFKITGYQVFEGKNAPSRARKEVKWKDIIYATVRPYLKRIAVVPKELDGEICSTGFCVIRCNDILSNYKFIFYILQTDWITETMADLQRGSNYPAITDKDLHDQLIPLPEIGEQAKIAEILSSVDDRIEKESDHKDRLETLKKGLMQVLLAGRIRVKI